MGWRFFAALLVIWTIVGAVLGFVWVGQTFGPFGLLVALTVIAAAMFSVD